MSDGYDLGRTIGKIETSLGAIFETQCDIKKQISSLPCLNHENRITANEIKTNKNIFFTTEIFKTLPTAVKILLPVIVAAGGAFAALK